MSQQSIARRYAQALYEEAEAQGVMEAVDGDVHAIRDALDASRELAAFFASPVVSRERKRTVVRSLFAERVSETTVRFVEMLVEKRREDLFADVADAFLALRDEHLGIVGVPVRSARPLDADAEQAVGSRMKELTGKDTRLSVTVDPALRGGIVVRVGDTVYDGSVKNRLESLKDRLVHGTAASG